MDSRRESWFQGGRNRGWLPDEIERESFDVEQVDGCWVFDEDEEFEHEPGSDGEVTEGPGGSGDTMLNLSRSLATAFLIADIGIRLTCLDRLLEDDRHGGQASESLGRFFRTLCHSVEEDDRWRVETTIACLRERLQPVRSFSNECAEIVGQLEVLLGRLAVRCLSAFDKTEGG
jgi:hypothetical protein